MLFFPKLLAVAYIIYLIVVSFLAYKALPKGWRFSFVKVGLIVPPMLFVFFIKTLFTKPKQTRLVYQEDLATTEDRIEAKRVQLFGGERMSPSVSARWKASFLERSIEETVQETKKILGFARPQGA